MKIGVHCSIRNGYNHALEKAKFLGCNCLQMFTHSPRVWKFSPPTTKEIEEFKMLRKKLNLSPLVIHTAYLPNPASSNEEIYQKTKELLKLEFELVELFKAEYLVMHPGSYSEGKTINDGISQVVNCIDFCFEYILKKYKSLSFILLLENVCGNGRKIGRTFTELTEIIYKSKFSKYIGICIDTAHTFSFGYDIRTDDRIYNMLEEIRKNSNEDKIKLIHLNDSKTPLGSKIDLHEHIGKGYIGIDGFKNIIKHFSCYPLILETPKECSFDKISDIDKKNINVVKSIISTTETSHKM
jgi:deoxyribonuclease-4